MKGLPLEPSDFEGKGVLDLELLVKNKAFFTIPTVNSSHFLKKTCFLSSNNSFGEPTSVLDSTISGGHTSSSTPSSSHGGGGGGSADTGGVGAVLDADPFPISSNAGGVESDLLPIPPCLEFGAAAAAGGSFENLLSTVLPSQEQSIFRWGMGNVVEEPPMGNLNRSLQIGGDGGGRGGSSSPEFEFSGGLGVVDQGGPFGPNSFSAALSSPSIRYSTEKANFLSEILQSSGFNSSSDLQPLIFNPNITHHALNPSFFLPLHHEQAAFRPPQALRPNLRDPLNGCLGPNWSFSDAHQQPQQLFSHLQLLPHYLPPKVPSWPSPNPITGPADEPVQIQTIMNQLYDAADIIQMGNFILAQGILARLNHFLSPTGKPYIRAAFYCKEALQLLLETTNNVKMDVRSPSDLIFKISAYKLFSEISPLVEFSNFSINQVLLEAFEGFDRIHVVDFDIGLGGQWASLMQELALRGGARATLKITALVPARRSGHDHLQLCLVRENLFQFAGEMNIEFEFEVSTVESFVVSGDEAIGVNLPIRCLAEYDVPLPMVLWFVKRMLPRVVVTVDSGCEMTDLPFASHVVHALRSCSSLLESIDAVGLDLEAMQRIERFLIGPGIEKMVTGHFRRPGKSGHWRDIFGSSGFLQLGLSDFAGFQGECVVRRACVRGFHVEKRRPSMLVLSWMQKELMSVSVWKC